MTRETDPREPNLREPNLPDPDDAFHARADELDAYLRDLDKVNSLALCNEVAQYAEYKMAKVSARIEVAQLRAQRQRMTDDEADWLYRATVVKNMTDRAIRRLDGIRRSFQREAADEAKAQYELDHIFVSVASEMLQKPLYQQICDESIRRVQKAVAA